MSVPRNLRYSSEHHWVKPEGDLWRVGLTEFAAEAIGQVTMVRLFESGEPIEAGDEMGELEAAKAMSDLYMPVSAVVVEANPALCDQPELVSADPYCQGWLCKIRPAADGEFESLLSASSYLELIGVGNA